jgi:hypothetical protein
MHSLKTHVSELKVGNIIKGWSVKMNPCHIFNYQQFKNNSNWYDTDLSKYHLWMPTKKIDNWNENKYKFIKISERRGLLNDDQYELCNPDEIKQKLLPKELDRIFKRYIKHHHEKKTFLVDNTQYVPIYSHSGINSIKHYVITNNNETLLLSSEPKHNLVLTEITKDLILINDELRFNLVYKTLHHVELLP